MPAPATTSEEVTELLGDEVDDSIVEQLVDTGATLEQIGEALDDLEHERRFGESRIPASRVIAEARTILEELPFDLGLADASSEDDADALEGLTITTDDNKLGAEP